MLHYSSDRIFFVKQHWLDCLISYDLNDWKPTCNCITDKDCLNSGANGTSATAYLVSLFSFFSPPPVRSASVFPSLLVCMLTAIHVFIFNIILPLALLTGTRSTQMAAVENYVTISLATPWAGFVRVCWGKQGGVLRRELRKHKREMGGGGVENRWSWFYS